MLSPQLSLIDCCWSLADLIDHCRGNECSCWYLYCPVHQYSSRWSSLYQVCSIKTIVTFGGHCWRCYPFYWHSCPSGGSGTAGRYGARIKAKKLLWGLVAGIYSWVCCWFPWYCMIVGSYPRAEQYDTLFHHLDEAIFNLIKCSSIIFWVTIGKDFLPNVFWAAME